MRLISSVLAVQNFVNRVETGAFKLSNDLNSLTRSRQSPIKTLLPRLERA
jgi:hypothetical protein